MENDTAPPYTPSRPSPDYSSGLLPGEQIVESTRRTSFQPPTGVYRRITDSLTVVLRDQHPCSVYPVYGRNGIVRGDVILNSNAADLTSVMLKLEGRFLLRASGTPVWSTFLSVTYVLWSVSHAPRCPQTMAYEVVFPLTFDDDGQARALPPTFETSELRAACTYSLTIELSRRRWQFRSILKGSEAIKVPLSYRPRSRPHMPMLPSYLPFMSTVKCSPEEWHEIICTLPMTQGSGLAPVECLLFIPSVRVYALSDIIPFHLQIRGSSASLIPFLEQGQDSRQDAIGQRGRGVLIRIYIFRQTSVRIHGQPATATCSLGEGKIEPSQSLTSSHHTFVRHPLGEGLDTLDWDGVLRCGEEVTIPSFSTNQISVQDSIVLSITPRQPLKSPLIGIKHSCPIRLVTDPWSDDAMI